MVLVYSHDLTARLTYIARFLLTGILKVPVEFTERKEDFLQFQGPRINYSTWNSGGIDIEPSGLLADTGCRQFSVPVSFLGDLPFLFPAREGADFPFDVFAASFYMVTRYEEYLPQLLDVHGRVVAENSLAYRYDFFEKPVVDLWAYLLRRNVEKKYPGFHFPPRKYQHVPTIDVDIAWAYRYRGFWRTAGAAAKSFVKFDIQDNYQRFRTLALGSQDPYDRFTLLRSWFIEFNVQPVFFFLLGNYGRFDKNIDPAHPAFRKLIFEINTGFSTGIHPSYASNEHKELVDKEIKQLWEITREPVKRSRQHFLKLSFPDTYQNLLASGITEDYSLGHASRPGFRAGTCTPFPFYDLTSETETELMITPFQVMDGTLQQYLKLTPVEAISKCVAIISEIKKVNGTFVSLWHNESLSEMRCWKGWQSFYYQLLELAR